MWVEMLYSENEGASVIICATHDEPAERGFSVNISYPAASGKHTNV